MTDHNTQAAVERLLRLRTVLCSSAFIRDAARAVYGTEAHAETQIPADIRDVTSLAAAQAERIKELETERDEAIKDRNAHAEHVLRVAAEAKDGFAALEEIDACWDAYGTAGNRMNLTLSEQIASTLRELDDERENHGNAEGELKMAEEELAQLRATPPAAPSLPADVKAALEKIRDWSNASEMGVNGLDGRDAWAMKRLATAALAPFADRVAGDRPGETEKDA